MQINEAAWDRGVRILVAAVLVMALAILGTHSVWWVGGLFAVGAVVLAVTGAVGFCPLYWLFGVRTCEVGT